MQSEQQYIDLFRAQRQLIDEHSAAPMNVRRDEAFSAFQRLGFPTKKCEEYRYTDVPTLFAPDYGVNLARLQFPVDPYRSFRCDVPNLSTSLYFVVNDSFYKNALPKASLPEGVTVGSLKDEAAKNPHFIEKYYGKLAAIDTDAIAALNTMLAQDGLVVRIPRGVQVERAIQVVNILRSDVDLMVNRRVLIVLEQGASAKLLFCDDSADDRRFLGTQVIEVFLDENANLELYCLEKTHTKNTRLSNLYIRQASGSRLHHNIVTLHNGTTRNTTRVELCGEGAECELNGCVVADQQQHVDNNTLIDHRAPHCQSSELYKYVLDGHSTGAFAGRVLVRPGAQQTVSQETNQNLCASREARMFTQPMLEIYADDVKCAHGSTVGQLNDAALFYMRQRGIPLDEARLLLELAFVGEVVDTVRLIPLRDRLHHLVQKRFRGELSQCDQCGLKKKK